MNVKLSNVLPVAVGGKKVRGSHDKESGVCRKPKGAKGTKRTEEGATKKSLKNGSFPPKGDNFKAPGKGDARGPCPAIDTLANHGFINRNGKDVLMTDLIQALLDVHDVAEKFLEGIVRSAINLGLTAPADPSRDNAGAIVIDGHQLDISNLGDPSQEHDASLVRQDDWFCDEEMPSTPADGALVDALLLTDEGAKSFLDAKDVAKFQQARIADTVLKNDGSVDAGFNAEMPSSSLGGLSAQKFLIMVLGQDEGLGKVDKLRLEQWLRDETIPDGHAPNPDDRHDPGSAVAFEVREFFRNDAFDHIKNFENSQAKKDFDDSKGEPLPRNSTC
jgi:hypothetical protein